jgi:hypothetical protein
MEPLRSNPVGRHLAPACCVQPKFSQDTDTAVWLALDAPQDLTGKFLRDRKVIPW